jgi:hypothetical protein
MMAKFRELSVREMLDDPIVRALMAADGVAAAEVEALLRAVAKSREGGPVVVVPCVPKCHTSRS